MEAKLGPDTPLQDKLSELIEAYGLGSLAETQLLVASLRPAELARLLESLPPKMRDVIWGILDDDTSNHALHHLNEEVRGSFLDSMDTKQLVAAADELATDDFADILHQLPERITQEVLESLDARDRARVEAVLEYADDCAGGLMDTDTVTVRPRHALELVIRYLRLRKDLPDSTDNLIVVNSRDEYVGILPLAKLLTSDPSVTVREVMVSDRPAIPVDLEDTEVARIFTQQDLISAPVVDDTGKLLGRITIDDVVDVILDDATEAVMNPAGLDVEDDSFAPVFKSFQRRSLWLTINLATAFLAAAVINLFEETIAKVVALAVLMPIVASMGGNAGTQSLTVAVRAIATKDLTSSNVWRVIRRECIVGLINGLIFALVMGVVGILWFGGPELGYVIAAAMVINLVVAGFAGTVIPVLLDRAGIDPALASGAFVTTVTDVVGFFAFLGLAAVVLI